MSDTEYGVQEDGSFTRKHIDEIRSDQKQNFKNAVGEDIEVRQSSPQIQLLDANAIELARLWQVVEDMYYASFFEDATGEQLDKQLALAGYSRIPARSATGEVEFSRGDPAPDDITISSGTVVTTQRTETKPAIPFETTEGVVLSEGTTSVTAPIEALKPWQTELDEEWLGEETNVGANSITVIDDPVAGVDAVANPAPTGDEDLGFVSGRDRETDPEFKLRYQNTLAGGGKATLGAVKADVFNADPDIRSVGATEIRDSNQGYGVEVTVLAPGVPDDTVAQAIVESRAGGLESFGAESGTGVLDDGTETTEFFERATEVTITVDATITTSGTFPTGGIEEIEDRIVRYIGGVANDGLRYPGLEIAEDVIYDQVFRRLMEEQGVIEADLQIAISGNALGTSNVTINAGEAAMTDLAEISITEA
ncbi:baseplate J protein [haloarchaeon 3A1-DGR]|nr:baseplate J protein [haloarchaeon 3A1-DGR]